MLNYLLLQTNSSSGRISEVVNQLVNGLTAEGLAIASGIAILALIGCGITALLLGPDSHASAKKGGLGIIVAYIIVLLAPTIIKTIQSVASGGGFQ